ncbi:MAG TPA: hypothetical protein EYO86_04410 [Pelagibacterales bacterium]|nr:hypothetical protein [Pelagibacterales bacterium]
MFDSGSLSYNHIKEDGHPNEKRPNDQSVLGILEGPSIQKGIPTEKILVGISGKGFHIYIYFPH